MKLATLLIAAIYYSSIGYSQVTHPLFRINPSIDINQLIGHGRPDIRITKVGNKFLADVSVVMKKVSLAALLQVIKDVEHYDNFKMSAIEESHLISYDQNTLSTIGWIWLNDFGLSSKNYCKISEYHQIDSAPHAFGLTTTLLPSPLDATYPTENGFSIYNGYFFANPVETKEVESSQKVYVRYFVEAIPNLKFSGAFIDWIIKNKMRNIVETNIKIFEKQAQILSTQLE